MNIRIGRSKKTQDKVFSSVRSEVIDKQIDRMISQYGKEYCLDIGCGSDSDNRFQTIDIDPDCNPTYVGDIRAMFAPSPQYAELRKTSALNEIPVSHFMVLRLKHVIEHIEWIYQLTFFEWIYSLVATGGLIVIDTPNLEYIAKMYIKNLARQDDGKAPKYPSDEHPDIDISQLTDMQRWSNFKIFSGCSPGDYHHACFDRMWLSSLLITVGFERIYVCNSATLRVVAYKAEVSETVDNIDSIIDQLGL